MLNLYCFIYWMQKMWFHEYHFKTIYYDDIYDIKFFFCSLKFLLFLYFELLNSKYFYKLEILFKIWIKNEWIINEIKMDI